jgi:general nucleoside transport system ATP-binding protein
VGRAGRSRVRHPDTVAAGAGRNAIRLLILDQPTRGLDVGSIEFIHRRIIAKRDAGAAILLVSAELDEVLELSDRIGVMYRGEMVALMDGRTADRENVGLLMARGASPTADTEAA